MRSVGGAMLAATLLAALLTTSACGADDVDEPPHGSTTRTVSIGGQTALVTADRRAGPRRLLLVMHGYGGDRTVSTRPAFRDLVRAGWVVASSDAHGDAWGDAASQDDYVALDRWVRARFDIADTAVLGVSMGAIAGLDLLAAHRLPGVSRWLGVSPVLDLASTARADGDLQALVEHSVSDAASVLAHDPSALPVDGFDGVTLTITVTPDDTLVSPELDRRWAHAYGARVVPCAGGHASADCYDQAVSALVAEESG